MSLSPLYPLGILEFIGAWKVPLVSGAAKVALLAMGMELLAIP